MFELKLQNDIYFEDGECNGHLEGALLDQLTWATDVTFVPTKAEELALFEGTTMREVEGGRTKGWGQRPEMRSFGMQSLALIELEAKAAMREELAPLII